MRITSPKYKRKQKNWHLLGKIGKVVSSTLIRVSSQEFSKYTPYSFVIVEFEGKKFSLMSIPHCELKDGQDVKFVCRRLCEPSSSSIIDYGVKVAPL